MEKVLVLDPEGKPKGKYPAALCRKLLRRKQAKVHSRQPFTLILRSAKILTDFNKKDDII